MRAAHNPPRLVSAGAGSGKTWRIVRSLLDHVEAGVAVERLAAVTFTEAAAAELQQRLRAGLLAAGRVAEAGRVETAAICTIHSFALLLVQRYPLAAGLPPSPHVLDEVSSRAMLRRLLASWLRREADASLRAVLDAGLGPGMGLSARGFRDDETPEGRLQALVQQVIDKARALAMSPEAVESEGRRAAARALGLLPPSGDAAALEAAFGEAMVEAFAWQAAQPEDKRRKTDAPLHEALRQMRLEPEAEPFDHALRLHGVGRSKTAERELPALFPAASALAETHPAMRARVEAVVVAVFGVAAAVLRAYAAEKDRLGALDFEDMQLRALTLLQGRPGEAAPYAPLIAGALPVVVVDEFQDSAPLQFQLFEALRAAGASVTYVGDLKQGIYGFRGADADLFGALLARARRLGHPVETLDRSRRSRPELVGFANAVFGALLPRHGMPFDPLTADNDYTRGVCPPAGPCVEVAFYDKPNVHAPKLRAGVARVLSLLASGRSVLDRATRTPRPLRAGDIAVLAYAHNDLAQWAEALRAAGVATVREAPGWADTLEVRLVRAWLAMLSSPRDSAAAAAVLLSELYGLSQRAVAALTLARVSGSPRLALLRDAEDPAVYGLTPSERYALARCADDLKQCREWLRQLPLPEAVERCLARVDLAARLSLRLDARAAAQLRANVAAVVAHAHQLADRGDTALGLSGATGATLENLLLALDRSDANHLSQPRVEAGEDAVRLVTLHGAKGMEYPVVVLDMLGREVDVRLPRVESLRPGEDSPKGALDPEALLGPEALAQSGVLLLPEIPVEALRGALQTAYRGDGRRVEEWLRLFYVAVTRARESLVLLWPQAGGGTTRRLRDVVAPWLDAPPAGTPEGTTAPWMGTTVRTFAPVTVSEPEAETEPAAVEGIAALGAELAAEMPVEMAPPVEEGLAGTLRLATVSPTELCQVADCPEVPRVARFARGERHALARVHGVPVTVRPLPNAEAERRAVPASVGPPRIGLLVHAAVERASLDPSVPANPAADRALAAQVLAEKGQTESVAALEGLIVATLAALRAAAAVLGATGEPVREVPFVLGLGEGALQGVIDLVVPVAGGLHVVDLKTHLLAPGALGLWAAYYQPQLDAYALALETLTGQPVLGRHLAVPAAGALATLPGAFDALEARGRLGRLADALAMGARGPARACATCGWSDLCRVGQAVKGAPAEAQGEGVATS